MIFTQLDNRRSKLSARVAAGDPNKNHMFQRKSEMWDDGEEVKSDEDIPGRGKQTVTIYLTFLNPYFQPLTSLTLMPDAALLPNARAGPCGRKLF